MTKEWYTQNIYLMVHTKYLLNIKKGSNGGIKEQNRHHTHRNKKTAKCQ